MIDPARITKLASFLFDVTPLPNLPNVNPLIDFNLVIPILTPRTEGTTTIRIDHRFSDRDLRVRTPHAWHKRSRAQYHSHAADHPGRLPASRRHVQSPLAEHHRRADLGAHIFAVTDQ